MTIEEVNEAYKPYNIELTKGKGEILTLFVQGGRNAQIPPFSNSFKLNTSTNKRLHIGVLSNYAIDNHGVIYAMINDDVITDMSIITPITDISVLDGIYDGSSHIEVVSNTIFTKKIGSWVGKKGANVKLLSKFLGKVEIMPLI